MNEMRDTTVTLIQNSVPINTSTTTIVYHGSSSIFTNFPLLSALIAFALAQFIKVFTSWYKDRHWDIKQLVGSGGMPSSHTATVTALATAVGMQEGFGGSLFATAFVLACVVSSLSLSSFPSSCKLVWQVMYDATGVRLHAGRQAEVLNQIVCELPDDHPLADSIPLRELLGHTPPQVIAGGFLGLATATVMWLIMGPRYRA